MCFKCLEWIKHFYYIIISPGTWYSIHTWVSTKLGSCILLDSNTLFSFGKTNVASFSVIFNPTSLSGLWRPKVMVSPAVSIDIISSSGTLRAIIISPTKLMMFMDLLTKSLPWVKKGCFMTQTLKYSHLVNQSQHNNSLHNESIQGKPKKWSKCC